MATIASIPQFVVGSAVIMLAILYANPVVAQPGCPVTDPTTSKVEVPWEERNHLEHDRVWYGSESLAVLLAPDGKWHGMGPEENYGNKLWLWSVDWDRRSETRPDLTVFARALHDQSVTSQSGKATHGFAHYWEAMLTGLGFPEPGCWEVVASYRDASVSFVVVVE